MLRRQFIQAVVAAAAAVVFHGTAGAADPATAPVPQPNVIVILADDLGYADLGVQGGKKIPTPNIDSIAHDGVRFTSGYVTGPVCSPTRAGLLTGRYQQRTGHEFQPRRTDGLLLGERTIAEDLRDRGYATAIVGKWNLGTLPEYNPTRRGFDEFFGFTAAVHDYLPDPPNGPRRQAREDDPSTGPGKLLRGTEVVDEPAYTTDAFAREAVSFIDRHHTNHHAKPYFLYLPFNAAHAPLQATEKYLSRFPNLGGNEKIYAAMVSAMDDAVGDVLRKVRETGDEENTLVFFLSDNGGAHGNTSTNGDLAADKGTVNEGGVRVPFLFKWPARIKGGQVSDVPVISVDIGATALAAAGTAPSADRKLDGVDVVTALTDPAAAGRPLFWRFGPLRAVRQGDWKVIRDGDNAPQLFDLKTDRGESKDLAGPNPAVVARLTAAWAQWDAGNIAPRWEDGSKRARKRQAAAASATPAAITPVDRSER
ncbi:MAG TPA: sulfatase-like hydrolase/transferase [Tepidisphaeraceae bacterium]|jgi:arylsulfatase A-like enzyme